VEGSSGDVVGVDLLLFAESFEVGFNLELADGGGRVGEY
jgi:hypothetical protein